MTKVKSDNWIMTYEQGLEFVEDLDGVSWYDAPKPKRLHRCAPQTTGYIGGVHIDRCSCGAVRINMRTWEEKNSRRH